MIAKSFNSQNYRYAYNGKEKDGDITGGGYDYGARIYDARLTRFLSLDPLQKDYPHLTPYHYAEEKPISKVDVDGRYALFIHFKLTKFCLTSLGVSDVQANLISHYASTFSDNPAGIKKTSDLSGWSMSSWAGLGIVGKNIEDGQSDNPTLNKIGGKMTDEEVKMLKYQASFNYTTTHRSQSEDYQSQGWHATRTDSEKIAMSSEDAVSRAQIYAWNNLFESATYGHMNTLTENSIGMEKLGLAFHGFQDINAHQGCVFKAAWYNGGGFFSWFGNEHDLHNDTHPEQRKFDNAQFMTKSAIVIHQVLTGDNTNLKDGLRLNTQGMSTDQLTLLNSLLNKAGYNSNGGENGTATLTKKK